MFYRDRNIIILDEPSSALDPISEYQLYDSIQKSTENKTLVFISHRLSSTKMANSIFLLKGGKIVEQGSHKELMKNNNDYAKLFLLQSEKYTCHYE